MSRQRGSSPGFTYASLSIALLLASGTQATAEEKAPPEDLNQADMLGTPNPEAEAEEAEEESEKSGLGSRFSVVVNMDFTTAYVFRGILQERNGFIWQPSIDIGLNLYEGEGALSSVDLGFGIWNSFQSEQTLAENGPANLYETDYYPSVTLAWSPGIETALTYQIYTSPNGAFTTIQQLDFSVGWDDSEVLGAFALYPTALFSFEVDGTSFGEKEGGYFELALEPGFDVTFPGDEEENYPLTLSFPLAVGLSLYDYYETEESDDTFGFFSFGFGLSIPLAFIPEDFGAWSAGAGVVIYVLGDTLEEVNLGDSPFAVGTGSITLEF
ncbi:MAG: hypothetical protein FJ144_04485 [Deltaproteobacteria bacterium]|nr:hypothetical protein [Deltaproteobacteria bacterium]